MKHSSPYHINFHTFINRCAHWLEYAIAAIMLPAVFISFYDVLMYVWSMVINISHGEQVAADFDILFALALQLVIAVEFIIMMVNKSPTSIIEVLTLAFAKKILVGKNGSMMELFFGVLAVLLLIGARIAYNYFEGNKNNPNIFNGRTLVKDAGLSIGVDLPSEMNITLEKLMRNQLKDLKIIPRRGEKVYFKDATLRINSMKGMRIEQIEIIPCGSKFEENE